MIKLRNIYNTYTYIPIYIQLNTHIYTKLRSINNPKSYGFTKEKNIYKEKKYVQYDSCKSTGHTLEEVQLI